MNGFSIAFTVEQTPQAVFAAINDVRGWWTGGIDGSTESLGDEFTYRHQDLHRSIQRITESIPGRRVVWHVVDSDLRFVRDHAEWTGTDLTFDIRPVDGRTEVTFTHAGLVAELECFEVCADTWSFYIRDSLQGLITGKAPVSGSINA
jgi:hypothetical protein